MILVPNHGCLKFIIDMLRQVASLPSRESSVSARWLRRRALCRGRPDYEHVAELGINSMVASRAELRLRRANLLGRRHGGQRPQRVRAHGLVFARRPRQQRRRLQQPAGRPVHQRRQLRHVPPRVVLRGQQGSRLWNLLRWRIVCVEPCMLDDNGYVLLTVRCRSELQATEYYWCKSLDCFSSAFDRSRHFCSAQTSYRALCHDLRCRRVSARMC